MYPSFRSAFQDLDLKGEYIKQKKTSVAFLAQAFSPPTTSRKQATLRYGFLHVGVLGGDHRSPLGCDGEPPRWWHHRGHRRRLNGDRSLGPGGGSVQRLHAGVSRAARPLRQCHPLRRLADELRGRGCRSARSARMIFACDVCFINLVRKKTINIFI